MSADRYISATRDRFKRPKERPVSRWYRCRCGRWWGTNKRFRCYCNAAPRSNPLTVDEQAESDRDTADIHDKCGHPEWAALVRSFLP